MTFDIALSGLAAARADLDVTGNNIANSNTTGFKGSRTEFADVFAESFGGISQTAVGNGVRLAAVRQQFQQGNIESTANTLDLAINGEGFFAVNDGSNLVYTRDGAFSVNRDGVVVNSRGQRLQAFPALDDEGTAFNTGGLADLRLDTAVGAPAASTTVQAGVNFSAEADVLGGTGLDIDPADAGSFSYTTAVTVYDSLGASHTATAFARRTDDLSYAMRLFVDGADLGTGELDFSTRGELTSPQPLAFPGSFTPPNGGDPLSLEYDFSGSTLFGSGFSINDLRQDGFTTGRLAGVEVAGTGELLARYTNGRSVALGKIALASFENAEGLQKVGDNAWAESFESGEAQLGEAGTSNLGAIQSGGLESSNVDLSEQLVRLITAQRTFQANSQVISAADQITQTAINIGR